MTTPTPTPTPKERIAASINLLAEGMYKDDDVKVRGGALALAEIALTDLNRIADALELHVQQVRNSSP